MTPFPTPTYHSHQVEKSPLCLRVLDTHLTKDCVVIKANLDKYDGLTNLIAKGAFKKEKCLVLLVQSSRISKKKDEKNKCVVSKANRLTRGIKKDKDTFHHYWYGSALWYIT